MMDYESWRNDIRDEFELRDKLESTQHEKSEHVCYSMRNIEGLLVCIIILLAALVMKW